jgi:hypothetical protein
MKRMKKAGTATQQPKQLDREQLERAVGGAGNGDTNATPITRPHIGG